MIFKVLFQCQKIIRIILGFFLTRKPTFLNNFPQKKSKLKLKFQIVHRPFKVKKCYLPFNQPTIWCGSYWKFLTWSLNYVCRSRYEKEIAVMCQEFFFLFSHLKEEKNCSINKNPSWWVSLLQTVSRIDVNNDELNKELDQYNKRIKIGTKRWVFIFNS